MPFAISQDSPLGTPQRLRFGGGVAFIAAASISLWFADSQAELRSAAEWSVIGLGVILLIVSVSAFPNKFLAEAVTIWPK